MPDTDPLNSSEYTYALLSDVTETSNALTPPWYYKLIIKLLKPIYRVALWRRHAKAKKQDTPVADYKYEIDTRFGREYPEAPVLSADKQSESDSIFYNTTIWCHAVSLGETNTIAPMLKVMLEQGAKIWMTNTTQTGFARTETVFADAIASKQMVHTFVPVDDGAVVERFVKHVSPDLAMFVETELWANILTELNRSGVPSVLVNARLSEKSFENYAKYEGVSSSLMQNITMIIAQDADSAKRFRRLGTPASKIRCVDSLKWSTGAAQNSDDQPLASPEVAEHLKTQQQSFAESTSALQRPIWVAGSTHQGEETLALNAHKQLLVLASLKNTLLILVPRHPERFDAVAEMIEAAGFTYHRRSLDEKITADTQVYLADTMGELKPCYDLADVAFVGGSLVNIGGHNPVEAASLAKPIVMGEYTQSCHEVVEALIDAGALQVVAAGQSKRKKKNESEQQANFTAILQHWLTHTEEAAEAGKQGQALVNEKSGAMQSQLDMVEALLMDTKMPKPKPSHREYDIGLDAFKARARDYGSID